jgi:hypothetical protein
MVSATSGMMAGKLEIRGTIDTRDLEKGFSKIEVGFKNMRQEAKSTQTDLTAMDIIGKGLSRTFLAVGLAATGMLYEAARKAPALAGDMAKIGVSWDRTIRALGVGLQPVFDVLSGWMESVASWAEGHPDLFAAVIGGTATVTALAGLLKLVGLGGWLSAGATALAPFLAPIAVGAVLWGLLALAGIGIGKGLVSQGPQNVLNVPITDAAKIQIANASQSERLDLQQRYGINFGGGAQMTPETDPSTGLLVSNELIQQRIIQNAMIWLAQQNSTISMRSMVMGQNNTYFNGTGVN